MWTGEKFAGQKLRNLPYDTGKHMDLGRVGKRGQIRPMIRFVCEFSAARVTTGTRISFSAASSPLCSSALAELHIGTMNRGSLPEGVGQRQKDGDENGKGRVAQPLPPRGKRTHVFQRRRSPACNKKDNNRPHQ